MGGVFGYLVDDGVSFQRSKERTGHTPVCGQSTGRERALGLGCWRMYRSLKQSIAGRYISRRNDG